MSRRSIRLRPVCREAIDLHRLAAALAVLAAETARNTEAEGGEGERAGVARSPTDSGATPNDANPKRRAA